MSYAPFGENYNNSGTTDYNFTGQNQDTVSGYDDFLFREYSPVQGRWMSPDPAGLAAVSLTNPQSWNRYEYVLNNPLALVDPLGMCQVWLVAQDPKTGNITTYCGDPADSGLGNGSVNGVISTDSLIGGGGGGGGDSANNGTLPTPQQTKNCMDNWSNSAMGKGVQFLSLNNFANNITSLKTWAEWTALPYAKVQILGAINTVSQAIGNTEFLSVTGGTSTVITAPTAAGIETTEAVGGELAPLAILGATVTDMRVQAHCEGFDVPMGIRGPGQQLQLDAG